MRGRCQELSPRRFDKDEKYSTHSFARTGGIFFSGESCSKEKPYIPDCADHLNELGEVRGGGAYVTGLEAFTFDGIEVELPVRGPLGFICQETLGGNYLLIETISLTSST